MHDIVPFAALLAIIAGAAALVVLFARWERRQAKAWTVVAEGAYDRVEHRRYHRTYWSGMAQLPMITHGIAELTVVHLQDGRSFAVDGHVEPDVPRGAAVRLRRNGLGHLVLDRPA